MDKIPRQRFNLGVGYRYRKNLIHNMDTYAWVHQYLTGHKGGLTVADLGCGRGDGMLFMSYFAKSIDGYDGNAEYLELAKLLPYYCPTEFYEINLEETPITKRYDVVISFETVEHLADPEFVISHLDCDLFIYAVPHNCPNSWDKNNPKYRWNHHKQIYKTAAEAAAPAKKYFRDVKVLMERKAVVQDYFMVPHRYYVICKK